MRNLMFLTALLLSCGSTRRLSRAELEPTPPKRAALASNAPRRSITVDGVELAVYERGPVDAPVIVCLHAIGHGAGDFDALASSLEKHYRVVSLDWPGHGLSGADSQGASALRYEALLAGVFEALQLKKAVILGNSIGGATAIRYASSHADRVTALVLANPGGLDPGGFLAPFFLNHLVSRFEWGARGEERFMAWFDDYYRGILRTGEAEKRRDAIVAAGYESAPRLVEAWQSFGRPEADVRGMAAKLTMPVLATWAMRDELVQWSRCGAAVEAIPQVKVVRFERSGHAAFLEEPESFAHALNEFLSSPR